MIYDVCVIGGGPAGMFSAFYSASKRMNTVLIEGNHELGGLLNLFLDYEIYDIPGQFGVLAHDYKRALIEQLKVSKANVFLGEIVEEIENIDELFYVTTTQQTILAKTAIAATVNGFSEVKRIEHAHISEKIQYDPPAFQQYDGPIAVIGHLKVTFQLLTRGIHSKRIRSIAMPNKKDVGYPRGRLSTFLGAV